MFRGLVGGKTLSEADLEPVLEKLKDHLIGKNVAAEIAGKLCQSVGKKLEGKVWLMSQVSSAAEYKFSY